MDLNQSISDAWEDTAGIIRLECDCDEKEYECYIDKLRFHFERAFRMGFQAGVSQAVEISGSRKLTKDEIGRYVDASPFTAPGQAIWLDK